MATSVYRAFRTATSAGPFVIARAPSDGMYVGEGAYPGEIFSITRAAANGDVVWAKDLDLGSGSEVAYHCIASNSTHVVLGCYHSLFPSFSFVAILLDSDGDIVWQVSVPLINESGIPFGFAIAPDSSVYVAGIDENGDTALIKLDAADGSVEWAVNLRETALSTSVPWNGQIITLSDGDPVINVLGPQTGDSRCFIQRLSAADGSVTWSRFIDFPGTLSRTALARDSSDNIYVVGPDHAPSTYYELPVIKFDEDGTTLWNRKVQRPSGFASGSMNWSWGHPCTAGTDGLYLTCYTTSPAGTTNAHTFVPAAGTVATNSVKISAYNLVTTGMAGTFYDAGGVGTNALGIFSDSSGGNDYAYVVSSPNTAADDATYGPYLRTTYSYDLVAGDATISTSTYTRASAPSHSSSPFSATEDTGTIDVDKYSSALVCTATGIASTVAFGTPIVFGLVGPYTITTAFGQARNGRGQPATGFSSTAYGTPAAKLSYPATGTLFATSFGLPAVSLNLAYQAESIGQNTLFGDAFVIRGVPPAPAGLASGFSAAPAWGLPAATANSSFQAEGFTATAFGQATARCLLPATALAPATAFGLPVVASLHQVSGFSSTAFGLARVGAINQAAGIASTLRFGLPSTASAGGHVATGFSSTAFGTPSLTQIRALRARSGRFRTTFGRAQAERTIP